MSAAWELDCLGLRLVVLEWMSLFEGVYLEFELWELEVKVGLGKGLWNFVVWGRSRSASLDTY